MSMCAKIYQQRFEALVNWNLEEEQCFLNVKQVKDCVQKLGISSSCSIDYNNYLEGTRCSANDLKGVRARYCISVCSGGCKRMTERRKLRCWEPSRNCSGLFQGCYKFRKSSIQKEHVCFKNFIGISAKKEKKKKKKGHIVRLISVGKESFWRIVVEYLGITIIKVWTRILNPIMTLHGIWDQYTWMSYLHHSCQEFTKCCYFHALQAYV